MEIIYDKNTHLKRFFQRYKNDEVFIKNDIKTRLVTLMHQDSYKIKKAQNLTHRKHAIFEYKIPLSNHRNCRVGYIHHKDIITIIFISDKIIKKIFCDLLRNTDLVD
jgi:hypothetical protein